MFVQTAALSNKFKTATLYDLHWSFYCAPFYQLFNTISARCHMSWQMQVSYAMNLLCSKGKSERLSQRCPQHEYRPTKCRNLLLFIPSIIAGMITSPCTTDTRHHSITPDELRCLCAHTAHKVNSHHTSIWDL
jgi:hypothetical protein